MLLPHAFCLTTPRSSNVEDQFKGNQYIVRGDERDFIPPSARRTFPEPLPWYLPRSTSAPSAPNRPAYDPLSSNAGRFSMSTKGMRKTLRQQRWRAEGVVRDVEDEMLDWLYEGGAVYLPDEPAVLLHDLPGTQVRTLESVFEVSRTPLQLVWNIEQDNFTRYVVHCCARYHNVVSYSKDISGRRLTFLLRPNVTRPDFTAVSGIATPPATETDYTLDDSSEPDTISVADSQDLGSDFEELDTGPLIPVRRTGLSAVAEQSDDDVEGQRRVLASLTLGSRRNLHRLEESAGMDADAESDDNVFDPAGDGELANSVTSLVINEVEPTNASTPKPRERLGLWDRRGTGSSTGNRAPSSPSSSPSPIQRELRFPNRTRTRRALAQGTTVKGTLFDFLYG